MTQQILGKLESFDPATDTVTAAAYFEQAGLFFEVSKIAVEKKVPVTPWARHMSSGALLTCILCDDVDDETVSSTQIWLPGEKK